MAARIKAVGDQLAKLQLNADDKALQAKIVKTMSQVTALAGQMNKMVMNADTTAITAKIAAETAALRALQQQMSRLQLEMNTTVADAKIAHIKKQIQDLDKYLSSDAPKTDIDISAAETKIAALEAELRVLDSDARRVELAAKGDALRIAIDAAMARIEVLKREAAEIQLGGDPAKLLAFEANLLALEAASEKLAAATKDLSASGGILSAAWAAVNSRLAITPSWIRPTMAGFSGLHLLLDALVEVLIIATASLLALAAGAAVAWPAIDQVSYNTAHLLQVMTIFGQDSGPLAKTNQQMDTLKKRMAPQVIEAFGGALALLTGQTGAFGQAGVRVVTMFDDMIARIDLWAKGQRTVGGILQSGIGFLAQLGRILGTVAEAIDNLITKDPGIAKMLLQVIQLVADAIDWFSKLPTPIVKAVLEIHGLWLWGSLLAGVLLKVTDSAKKAAVGLATLAANPWFWVIAAAAGFAALAVQGNKAGQSVQDFDAKLEAGLSALSASQALFYGLAQAMASVQKEAAGLSPSQIMSGWHGTAGIFSEAGDKVQYFGHELNQVVHGSTLHELGAIGDIVHGLFAPGFAAAGAAATEYQHDIANLNEELNKLTGSQRTLFAETGNLIRSGYTFQQSLALMDAAGVKWNDKLTLMQQKVSNLITGYSAMGIQGGILNNSLAAMNFQTEQQDSKVTQLNAAWDTFFKTISGGAAGFDAFATQAEGLYATMSQGSDKLTVSNGKASISLKATTSAAQQGTPSITGLNTASLQLRDSFVQTATAANTQLDNLTLMAQASSAGQKGTDLLTQATKDMVAQMLPAAKGSKEMTAILYALAQHGGYEGAGSFQALAKWVGNTHDPMANLDKITTQLTVDSANLLQDVQKLSDALGQTLNQAMAEAIFTASGGQAVMNAFAKSIKDAGVNSQSTRDKAVTLAQQLYSLTGNTTAAKQEFDTFTHALGLTQGQSDKLWKESLPALQNEINKLHGTNIPVSVYVSGSGVIRSSVSGLSNPNQNVAAQILFGGGTPVTPIGRAAGGLLLGGYGGGDIVPALLEPGEAVVAKETTRKFANVLKAMGVPGFQSGGTVGASLSAAPAWAGQQGSAFSTHAAEQFAGESVAQFKAAVAAQKAAQAAMAALNYLPLGPQGPLSASAATAQAFARSIMFAYGWGQNQFPPLQALWNQESGWNAYARNPSSGASGIPQNINGWAAYAPGDYQAQIRWGLAYISSRYGSPSAAWAHEVANNWYAAGGLVGPRSYAAGGFVGGGTPTFANPPEAAWLGRFAAAQKAEYSDWAALWHGFLRGPAKYRDRATLSELRALEKREWAEQVAFANILSKGLTPQRAQAFRAAAITEYNLAGGDKLLSRLHGGHPAAVAGLRAELAVLSALAKNPPAGSIAAAPNVHQIPGASAASLHLGPAYTAPGGVLTFDAGGVLPPGLSLAWNGTGAGETVTPAGGGVTIVLQNHGVIGSEGELDAWLQRSMNRLARTGRLAQAVKTAAR